MPRWLSMEQGLERFSRSRSEAIAAVAHEVGALLRSKQRERGSDPGHDLVEGARPDGAKERFQFREGELDRIEVGAVRRQESDDRAHRFDRGLHRRLLVHDQVVEHHDVAGPQGRHQDLLDVGEKGGIVDRSVEHGGCGHPVPAERGNDGMCLPMTARGVIAEPRAARAAPIPAEEIGRDARFVEKHVVARVTERLEILPPAARRCDISAALFVGVYRFF